MSATCDNTAVNCTATVNNMPVLLGLSELFRMVMVASRDVYKLEPCYTNISNRCPFQNMHDILVV